jgi:hypothetical protein
VGWSSCYFSFFCILVGGYYCVIYGVMYFFIIIV